MLMVACTSLEEDYFDLVGENPDTKKDMAALKRALKKINAEQDRRKM